MASEKQLWRWIEDGGLPGQWERIENSLSSFPDCVVNYKKRTFFVELKELDGWPKKGGALDLDLRPGQVRFFQMWRGEKYVLAQVGKERLWFSGAQRKVRKEDAIKGPFPRSAIQVA